MICPGIMRVGDNAFHCDLEIAESEILIGHDGPCENKEADAMWSSQSDANKPIRAMQG